MGVALAPALPPGGGGRTSPVAEEATPEVEGLEQVVPGSALGPASAGGTPTVARPPVGHAVVPAPVLPTHLAPSPLAPVAVVHSLQVTS